MSSRIVVELADEFIQTFASISTSNIQNSLLIEIKLALSNLGYSGVKVDKIIEELLIQDPTFYRWIDRLKPITFTPK